MATQWMRERNSRGRKKIRSEFAEPSLLPVVNRTIQSKINLTPIMALADDEDEDDGADDDDDGRE